MPFLLPKTQLPPTRSEASKQVNGTPRSCSALAAAIPEEPAPMTAAVGRLGIAPASQKVTHASSSRGGAQTPLSVSATRNTSPRL